MSIEKPGTGAGRRISATEAARNFSDVVSRVRYNDEVFVVERGGVAVCEIRPASYESGFTGADLIELVRSIPSPGDEYLDRVEELTRKQPPAEDPRWER